APRGRPDRPPLRLRARQIGHDLLLWAAPVPPSLVFILGVVTTATLLVYGTSIAPPVFEPLRAGPTPRRPGRARRRRSRSGRTAAWLPLQRSRPARTRRSSLLRASGVFSQGHGCAMGWAAGLFGRPEVTPLQRRLRGFAARRRVLQALGAEAPGSPTMAGRAAESTKRAR